MSSFQQQHPEESLLLLYLDGELIDALSAAGFERVERHVELSIFSEYRAQRPL